MTHADVHEVVGVACRNGIGFDAICLQIRTGPPVTDFFLSYNNADEKWASWIAFVLEEQGLTTRLQAWDFRPGSNFVLHMQEAAENCDRTIAVLSPAYFSSSFAPSEWAAAFAGDPTGAGAKLVPVMVERCTPPGLLKAIVHIEMIDSDEEEARRKLLEGIQPGRAKPAARPMFPGVAPAASPADRGRPGASTAYMPSISSRPSDIDRRRFIRHAFDTIAAGFENALPLLASTPGVEHDFDRRSSTEFAAEVFVQGKSVCRCRIWQGGAIGSDAISFAEGHLTGDATNEILSIPRGDRLVLSAIMFSFQRLPEGVDAKNLSPEQAFDYLWRRFVAPLER